MSAESFMRRLSDRSTMIVESDATRWECRARLSISQVDNWEQHWILTIGLCTTVKFDEDLMGMVGIDTTSNDAYILGQSGQGQAGGAQDTLSRPPILKSCLRHSYNHKYIARKNMGRCGDTIQVNTGRCSIDEAWTKHGRRKFEGHDSVLRRAQKSFMIHGLGTTVCEGVYTGKKVDQRVQTKDTTPMSAMHVTCVEGGAELGL
ncbi:hypothetical protein MTR67_023630 [Solanum verrucosum]|uniref:Uncharacterized protein n=1 Tax=Solanum verrucosum TaxID=315347 RepID=A0AAF0QWV7_SOLVR|nr:hypothetical protein MTR67_023630 [Solanum verrucosum]